MPITNFKDIIAWQKANTLTIGIYKSFSDCRDFSFRDQIQRASISIMNNIAEGYGRKSDKVFKNFLSIARGSLIEVQSMLLLAEQLGYITDERKIELLDISDEVAKLLNAFMKKLSTKD